MDRRDIERFEQALRERGPRSAGNENRDREIISEHENTYSVLILDSSGFTRITQEYGIIHFLSLILAMRDMVEPLLPQYNVIETWAEADNVYAVFPSAVDAVPCALEIQRTVRAENSRRAEPDRLPVCIGIGHGKLIFLGGKHIYGQEMNFASKLGEDIAEPDEILVTEAALSIVHTSLDPDHITKRSTKISGVELPYYCIAITE